MSSQSSNQPRSRNVAILFTDIVDSVGMKRRLGDAAYLRLLETHNELFHRTTAATQGARFIKGTGDGFLACFDSAPAAAQAALRFLAEAKANADLSREISVRIAVHTGEVMEISGPDAKPDVIGYAVDIAARVMGLATGGQILLTRHAFDDARQFVREHPVPDAGDLAWLAHGPYRFAGSDDDPLEVFEVGVPGVSPLRPPQDSAKARRSVAPEEEELFSWRPAIGGEIPRRDGWRLEARLGEGGFGEVWLARHARTKQQRVFKFCFDVDRLRSFKRELTLFRLLQQALGDRNDIARLFEVNLERPPYSLESEYSPRGDLGAWAESEGGMRAVPFETRIALLAGIAEAVAAAHSVGILHKDIKPGNVLIEDDADGAPRAKITDFGIGVLTDTALLEQHRITIAGFTVGQLTENDSSRTGTRLYAPPELLTRVRTPDGAEHPTPFTAQGDVYALGVLLFQLVVGDLSLPLAPGWERALEAIDIDPIRKRILRTDISEMVDGDPARRVQTAREVADRLGALDQRVAACKVEMEAATAQEEAARRAAVAEARRRRTVRFTIGAGAVFTALLITAAFFLQRERSLRDEAERQRAVAQSSLDFVEKFLINSPRTEQAGRDARVVDVLRDAAAQISPQFASEPAIRAALHSTLAGAFLWLGDLASAESESRAALVVLGGVSGAARSTEGQVVLLMLAEALWRAERADESFEPTQAVLQERTRTLGERDPATLEARTMFAHALKHAGKLDEAESEYRFVQSAYSGSAPSDEEARLDIEYHLALVQMDRAKALDPKTQIDQRNALNAEAAQRLERVYDARAQLWSPEDPRTAEAAAVLAQNLSRLGRFDRCDCLFESAIATMTNRLGADFWRTCETRCNYATMRVRQGRFEEAARLFETSRLGYRRSVGPDSWRTIETTRLLALTLGRIDRPAEGLQLLADLRAEIGDDNIEPEILAKVVSAATALQKQLASAAATSAAD